MSFDKFKNSNEVGENLYKMMILEKKAEVEHLSESKDVVSWDNNETYFYGLCDFKVKSSSLKLRCPFDIRKQEDTYVTYDTTCKSWCIIEMFKQNHRIEDMSNVPEKYRKVLAQKIKTRLLDFIIKV